jgi:bifunctional ADP-heptose synthase (sugar kinase/adenylyltransferase)
LKGPGRPLQPLDDRLAILAALRAVDLVLAFAGDTAVEVLRALAPDVYVKGGDYGGAAGEPPEAALARSLGGRVVYLPFLPGRSSTRLVERLLGSGP